MECPWCKKETVTLPMQALVNADTYNSQVRVVTLCCGNMVLLSPVRSYKVEIANPGEDDWGKNTWGKGDGSVKSDSTDPKHPWNWKKSKGE